MAIFMGLLSAQPCLADETLTLQGPSPRLIFDDNDGALQKWTVYGDDGGFEIETQSGSFKHPFRIAPTATADLYIGGGIGIDTTNPQTKLHVYSNGPRTALRLEADNDVGFDANWDILADSEEGLRFVDVAYNKFPLTIQNNAPNGSLFIGSTGSVGMGGGAVPDVNTKLDIRSNFNNGVLAKRLDGNAHYLRVENSLYAFRCGVQSSGDAQFGSLTAGKGLNMLAGGATKVLINASGQVSFGNTPPAITTHALIHQSGAHLTNVGVWANASSRDLKQDIEPITSERARDTVRALQPVGYRYKSNPQEPYVGFIAEDVPELVATSDRKSLAPMDFVAVLTKVVQDQDRELSEERQRNEKERQRSDKLERLVDSLTQRMADLEQRLEGAVPAK